MDFVKVPQREKAEVLAAFAAHKNEVTAGYVAKPAIQCNPVHSISYMLLAAPLAKLGRPEEARTAAAGVLKLQPAFHYRQQFAGVDCAPGLATELGETLRAVGLPD